MDIIDPHLHLFELSQGDYHWLKPENPPFWPDKKIIHHNFSEQDLMLDHSQMLKGFVHIEAGFDNNCPWREIQWLEQSVSLPFKTVACVDLTLSSPLFAQQITQISKFSSVVGVRHILDDEATSLLLQQQVKDNLAYLANTNLHFELQMPLTNTQAANIFAGVLTELPHLKCIINHAGWPPQASSIGKDDAALLTWQSNIKLLGTINNCAIKCSGWEMVNRHYQNKYVSDTVKDVIKAFGEDKVMLASNFPLTLFSKSYNELWQQYELMLKDLGLAANAISKLCSLNSMRWYRFND